MYMQPKCPSSVLLLLLLLVCWGLVVFFSGCNVMWCPCVHLGQMEQFFFPPLTPPQQQCCYCPQCACCITGTACVTAACCWPIMGCYNYGQRKKVRERYQYEANNTEDCCIACWCLPCSMCQVAREVKLNEFVNMARNSGQKKSILGPRKQFAEQEG